MDFFSLFVSVVIGLIAEPLPAALIGIIGVVTACLLKIGPVPSSSAMTSEKVIAWGLSGFSNSTVWLIFVAFMFAAGYERSGLGKRIALIMVRNMGRNTLGLGYAIAFSDLILSPFMPSNTARSGGTIFPVVRNIPAIYNSSPEENPRKIGAYITWVALATTCVTSSMFYTALAPNILAVSLVSDTGIISPSWSRWALYFLPAGIILILLVPLLTYYIYPPAVKKSEDVQEWAAKELTAMGKMSGKEIRMTISGGLALMLWISGEYLDINATVSALLVMCLMVLLNIISWNDILKNAAAWNVLLWFGSLVALAGGLKNTGFLEWFAGRITTTLSSFSPSAILVLLLLAFYLIHYFFASSTAHVAALLTLFLAAAGGIPGINLPLFTWLMLYSLGLMGILTPYATGPSPIWYGLGYIPARTFWLLGALFGMIFFLVLLAVGIPWIRLWI